MTVTSVATQKTSKEGVSQDPNGDTLDLGKGFSTLRSNLEDNVEHAYGQGGKDFLEDLFSGNFDKLLDDLKAIFNGASNTNKSEPKKELAAAAPVSIKPDAEIPPKVDAPKFAAIEPAVAAPAGNTEQAQPAVSPLDNQKQERGAPEQPQRAMEQPAPDAKAETVLDQNLDENAPTEDPTYDAATEAMAMSFGNGAVEKAGDFDHERIRRAADINGEWSIGSGYGGQLLELNGIAYDVNGKVIDADGDGVDDDVEDLRDALGNINDNKIYSQKEWEDTNFELAGGVEMSGQDIDNFITTLKDPKKRAAYKQQYMKSTGVDDKTADEDLNNTEKYLEAVKNKKLGKEYSQNDLELGETEGVQRALKYNDEQDKNLNSENGFSNEVAPAASNTWVTNASMSNIYAMQNSDDSSINLPSNLVTDDKKVKDSIGDNDALISSKTIFSSAPPLSEHWQNAQISPSDEKIVSPNQQAKVELAATIPAAQANAGMI